MASDNWPALNWADPLLLESSLREEEKLVRDSARAFGQSRLMPLAEAAAAQSIVQGNANSRGRVILDVRGRASEIPVQRNVK